MRVLVTGGAGLIGSNLVKILVNRGIEVNVLHLPKDDLRNLKGVKCNLIPGNTLDIESLKRAMKGCTQIYHLAAIYALWLPRMELMREVNVEGTRNVMQLCFDNKNIEKIVYTSSIALFGGQGLDNDGTEDSPFALNMDLYPITKYEAHKVVMSFHKKGLNVTIVAPTGPIGPGDYGPTPTGRAILSPLNLPVAIVLNNITNLGDVRDIAMGHILAMEKGKAGRSYLLGNENVEFGRAVALGSKLTGIKKPVLWKIPHFVLTIASYIMLLGAKIFKKPPMLTPSALKMMDLGLRADCSRAINELGLPTRPIEESLRDALIWFAENGYINDKKAVNRLVSLKK